MLRTARRPSLPPSVLTTLVEAADLALATTTGAAALRVVDDGGGGRRSRVSAPAGVGGGSSTLELGWRPLGEAHPLGALLGAVAPASWPALGFSCSGRARTLALDGDCDGDGDGDGVDGRAGGRGCGAPVPARLTVLFARDGASAGVIRRGSRTTGLGDSPEGVVADACRRALGLPTAPPPASTVTLWTLAWLDRLVGRAAVSPAGARVRSWPEVVACHPAMSGGVAGPSAPGPEPLALAAATVALAAEWPWARLRHDPGAVGRARHLPAPDLARWMDDGMFARWALSGFPPVEDLLDACTALLPEALAGRVAAVVVATGGGAP